MGVRIKRAFDPASRDDGRRYLVDRLWPRGVSKQQLQLAGWLKDLAPSPELRSWFGHDPIKYPEFDRRYRRELERNAELIARLAEEARTGSVTLVFAARDVEHCNASVLRGVLEERLTRPAARRR
jgi:uncharacterized protein YeaO (DUF488 family)